VTAVRNATGELPVIQKTYDLILWYVPILNRLPRDHKFAVGDRMVLVLYDLLEGLLVARYRREKLALLEDLASRVDLLRYQTRLRDFGLIGVDRHEHAARQLVALGKDLGAWARQQRVGRST
jgi:hypothetical protein